MRPCRKHPKIRAGRAEIWEEPSPLLQCCGQELKLSWFCHLWDFCFFRAPLPLHFLSFPSSCPPHSLKAGAQKAVGRLRVESIKPWLSPPMKMLLLPPPPPLPIPSAPMAPWLMHGSRGVCQPPENDSKWQEKGSANGTSDTSALFTSTEAASLHPTAAQLCAGGLWALEAGKGVGEGLRGMHQRPHSAASQFGAHWHSSPHQPWTAGP